MQSVWEDEGVSGASRQKQEEKAYAEMAALTLEEQWILQPSERPDFLVSGPDGEFGLEVTNCFAGAKTKKGAKAIREAHGRQKVMAEIRAEAIARDPRTAGLALSYLGPWTGRADVQAAIETALRDALGDAGGGTPVRPPVGDIATDHSANEFPDVLVSRATGPVQASMWRFMQDHAGSSEEANSLVQGAINRKLIDLPVYRVQMDDIRLLVTANSLMASGNINVSEGFRPQIGDFNKVYFLHFAKYLVEYPSGRVATLNGHTPASLSQKPERLP